MLEAESGYTSSSQAALDFQSAILGGRWSEAISLLPQVGIPASTGTGSSNASGERTASSGSSMSSSGKAKATGAEGGSKPTPAEQAQLWIAQQKYLELLESGSPKKALAVLRSELGPVTKDSEALHTLSG